MNFIREWQHRRQRRQHQKYAQTMGLFWKPCPWCGEDFGPQEWELMPEGTEVRHITAMYGETKAYEALCPSCCLAGHGRTMTDELLEEFAKPVDTTEVKPWPTGDDGNFLVALDDSELLG